MGDPAKQVAGQRNAPEVEAAWRAVPAHMVGEIVGGALHTTPRPARRHTIAASNLGEELGPPFKRGRGGPGGWVILDEPEVHLGPMPDIVVPDLAGWRRERMPDAVGAEDAPSFYDLAPDWACEVLSPRTEAFDRGEKVPVYARERVGHVWLVDPIEQTLECSGSRASATSSSASTTATQRFVQSRSTRSSSSSGSSGHGDLSGADRSRVVLGPGAEGRAPRARSGEPPPTIVRFNRA